MIDADVRLYQAVKIVTSACLSTVQSKYYINKASRAIGTLIFLAIYLLTDSFPWDALVE